jgi:fatty acid desaturase
VPDFRLCCRTVELNPVLRFLYWQMNYHTEHHMYAAVPCYNLRKLHKAILADMPPCPNGLVAAWRQIITIMRRQAVDPTYQYVAPLPGREGVAERALSV